MRMHADQLTIPVGTVRALVDEFPQWRGLAVRAVESAGTVNAIFRIGGDLTARLPLRPGDPVGALRELKAEAAAARELAGRTRFPTPRPVAIGAPGPAPGRDPGRRGGWVRPTRPLTSSPRGTCWRHSHGAFSGTCWAATTSTGPGGERGPSCRPWVRSGTTWTPTPR